jgi:hypothetical protein
MDLGMTEEEIESFDYLQLAALRRRRELQQQQEDRRIAVLAAVIGNMQGGGKKNGELFTPLDFHYLLPSLPRLDPPVKVQSLEEQDALMERIFASMSRGNA